MNKQQIISSRQIKAARALLDWSQDDLAEASGLSIATIRKIESGHTSPRGNTNEQLRAAFEKLGLEFWEPGGVRFRPEEITVYEGLDGTKRFFEDVYQTLNKEGGEALTITPDSKRVLHAEPFYEEFAKMYFERMNAIKHKSSVKCIQTENRTDVAAPAYCEYRFLSQKLIGPIFYYIHGDKVSFKMFRGKTFPKTIVITSKELSDQYREHFYALWDQAVPISVPEKRKK